MLDNPTYINENTPIWGLQYKDNKKMKRENLSNEKIITVSNKYIVICAFPLVNI